MDRAEATGLGVAVAGHVLLLAILSVGFAASTRKPILTEPMEVAFVEEVGLESTAPAPANEAPAPKLAKVEGPVEPDAPPPPAPEPVPVPQPQAPAPPAPPVQRTPPKAQPVAPKPAPRPVPPKPAPAKAKAAPAKPAPAKLAVSKAAPATTAAKTNPASTARPTGRLKGILSGISDSDSPSKSAAPPARAIGPAVKSSLAAEVRRQLKPHWKAPTGADVEQLRTELSIRLARDGSVTDVDVLRTTGQTASNRPQVRLHQEQAVRAVRLASPFRLPAEYYDAWKLLSPIGFDKRLSQ
jgi:outer membrane biosynthesis protein TonB